MKFKAVIFDMDGVLIDSELYWTEEGVNFFSKRGIVFTKEIKAKMTGNSMRANMQWVKDTFGFTESIDELCAERVESSDHIYDQVTGAMPGADALLKKLKASGLKIAIASGSFLYRIETIVKRFGWQEYFEALVSTDHVNLVGKPSPDIFIHTAQVLHLKSAECCVVEDSVNGVEAAKAAGMSCIAALDERWSWGDFSEADVVVKSLEDPRVLEFLEIV